LISADVPLLMLWGKKKLYSSPVGAVLHPHERRKKKPVPALVMARSNVYSYSKVCSRLKETVEILKLQNVGRKGGRIHITNSDRGRAAWGGELAPDRGAEKDSKTRPNFHDTLRDKGKKERGTVFRG